MTTRSLTMKIAVPTALGLLIAVAFTFGGCKKDEEPPPLPSASAEPEEPEQVLTLQPEEDAGDSDADAAKVGGPYKPKQSLANCCAALRQNAASAPPPTNGYMLAAAGVCEAAAGSGQDKNTALAGIQAALKGVGMPAACY